MGALGSGVYEERAGVHGGGTSAAWARPVRTRSSLTARWLRDTRAFEELVRTHQGIALRVAYLVVREHFAEETELLTPPHPRLSGVQNFAGTWGSVVGSDEPSLPRRRWAAAATNALRPQHRRQEISGSHLSSGLWREPGMSPALSTFLAWVTSGQAPNMGTSSGHIATAGLKSANIPDGLGRQIHTWRIQNGNTPWGWN